MPNKYQLLNEMARETLKEITSKPEEWMKFLDTAMLNVVVATPFGVVLISGS